MRIWAAAQCVLSFLGAAVAGFLWTEHVRNADVPCTSAGGCELVAQSRWAHVALGPWQVDVALLGLAGYCALLALGLLAVNATAGRTQRLLHGVSWAVTLFGVCFSWYLQWAAHFKVHAFCIWCRASAIIMTLLFLAASSAFFGARPASITPET